MATRKIAWGWVIGSLLSTLACLLLMSHVKRLGPDFVTKNYDLLEFYLLVLAIYMVPRVVGYCVYMFDAIDPQELMEHFWWIVRPPGRNERLILGLSLAIATVWWGIAFMILNREWGGDPDYRGGPPYMHQMPNFLVLMLWTPFLTGMCFIYSAISEGSPYDGYVPRIEGEAQDHAYVQPVVSKNPILAWFDRRVANVRASALEARAKELELQRTAVERAQKLDDVSRRRASEQAAEGTKRKEEEHRQRQIEEAERLGIPLDVYLQTVMQQQTKKVENEANLDEFKKRGEAAILVGDLKDIPKRQLLQKALDDLYLEVYEIEHGNDPPPVKKQKIATRKVSIRNLEVGCSPMSRQKSGENKVDRRTLKIQAASR